MAELMNNVVNLGNSIVGVGILAMPYSFQQCGIILGILLMMGSAYFTRFSCHILLKGSLLCRKETYEMLAWYTFGMGGKVLVEGCLIGFLLGILISFFVAIGDILPNIIMAEFDVPISPGYVRIICMFAMVTCIALPLSLIRNISHMAKYSAIAFMFYFVLVFRLCLASIPQLLSGKWIEDSVFWRPQGLLQSLPIYSLALSCQAQIFEIYDNINERSLDKMNKVIRYAINMAATLYVGVGVFGCIAYCGVGIEGNILVTMPNTFDTELMKIAFVFSIAISIPLIVFPLRTSVFSLFIKQKPSASLETHSPFMTDVTFTRITLFVTYLSLVIAIMIPNIEFALGLLGSTIGITIAFVFPSAIFINVTSRHTFERVGAQISLGAGIFLVVACTFATLQAMLSDSSVRTPMVIHSTGKPVDVVVSSLPQIVAPKPMPSDSAQRFLNEQDRLKEKYERLKPGNKEDSAKISPKTEEKLEYIRKEPPVPQEPDSAPKENVIQLKQTSKPVVIVKKLPPSPPVVPATPAVQLGSKLESKKKDVEAKQEEVLKKLEAQQEEQKKLIEEQKLLLEELKAHKDSHIKTTKAEQHKLSENEAMKNPNNPGPNLPSIKLEIPPPKQPALPNLPPIKLEVPPPKILDNPILPEAAIPVKKLEYFRERNNGNDVIPETKDDDDGAVVKDDADAHRQSQLVERENVKAVPSAPRERPIPLERKFVQSQQEESKVVPQQQQQPQTDTKVKKDVQPVETDAAAPAPSPQKVPVMVQQQQPVLHEEEGIIGPAEIPDPAEKRGEEIRKKRRAARLTNIGTEELNKCLENTEPPSDFCREVLSNTRNSESENATPKNVPNIAVSSLPGKPAEPVEHAEQAERAEPGGIPEESTRKSSKPAVEEKVRPQNDDVQVSLLNKNEVNNNNNRIKEASLVSHPESVDTVPLMLSGDKDKLVDVPVVQMARKDEQKKRK